MIKKTTAFFLILVLCTLPLAASALESGNEMIAESALYISSTSTTLIISSSGTATCTGKVTGYQGTTTKVEIYLYLQQYKSGSWVTVQNGSWYASFNTYQGTLQKQLGVTRGYQYRVKASYYAYSGSACESLTDYSDIVPY